MFEGVTLAFVNADNKTGYMTSKILIYFLLKIQIFVDITEQPGLSC
jgi:hypothetical protein